MEAWLADQPGDHAGIWLKLAKKSSGGEAYLTQAEAVDSGLCFGWIDRLINRFDERFYRKRYTPRRPRSKWREINVKRAEQLVADARVQPRGLKQIEAAKADGRWGTAYPPTSRITLPENIAAVLAKSPAAGALFATLTGANRFAILYRLHDQRHPDKRAAAIGNWLAMLERGETVHG